MTPDPHQSGPVGGRIDFLVRRLVLLAGELRDQLATGDWEAALPVQEEFDIAFASLQSRVERGERLTTALVSELTVLRDVHLENERLAADLQRQAGQERATLKSARRIGAYAPLGLHHEPGPRYLDGSA